jgi:hypothetical protein
MKKLLLVLLAVIIFSSSEMGGSLNVLKQADVL